MRGHRRGLLPQPHWTVPSCAKGHEGQRSRPQTAVASDCRGVGTRRGPHCAGLALGAERKADPRSPGLPGVGPPPADPHGVAHTPRRFPPTHRGTREGSGSLCQRSPPPPAPPGTLGPCSRPTGQATCRQLPGLPRSAGHGPPARTHQVIDRNCRMQNSTASPFLCHWQQRETETDAG